jgi:hypothetical protein
LKKDVRVIHPSPNPQRISFEAVSKSVTRQMYTSPPYFERRKKSWPIVGISTADDAIAESLQFR